MNRIVLVGVGKGGQELLSLLLEDQEVEVLGVATRRPDSPGLAFARDKGVFGTTDISELLALPGIDVVIDASGSQKIHDLLAKSCPAGVETISGLASNLMWNMVDERKRRELDQKALYNIGLMLADATREQEVLDAILKSATELIKAPAASIALFDPQKNELQLSCALGFSKKFRSQNRWLVRDGGLSEMILRSDEPVVFEDCGKHMEVNNPMLIDEGIRAICAVPLRTRGRTIGVLYVDDFKVRNFSEREVSLLALLGNQAALAIDKAQLIEDQIRLATTDGLTGAFNYRHFQDTLRAEVERATRYAQSFCLTIIDLDFFKTINDRLGHTKGDEVLKKVSKAIKKSIRATDFLARYGGEEFAVILPHATLAQSRIAAEKIRTAISELKIKGGRGEHITLTASAGVADFPACGVSGDELISAADNALLLAKRTGRNRVCFYPDVRDKEGAKVPDGLCSRLRGHDYVTVGALIAALQEARSSHKNQAKVASDYFARSLRLSREQREALHLGIQIHSTGHSELEHRRAAHDESIRPADIPGGLTDLEWAIMHKHSASVVRVIRSLRSLDLLTGTILHHHERWDGEGYPDGLKGEDIPLLARILSVCEAYQELVDTKPTGKGLTPAEAILALRGRAGGDLDPDLVEVFCRAGALPDPTVEPLGEAIDGADARV